MATIKELQTDNTTHQAESPGDPVRLAVSKGSDQDSSAKAVNFPVSHTQHADIPSPFSISF